MIHSCNNSSRWICILLFNQGMSKTFSLCILNRSHFYSKKKKKSVYLKKKLYWPLVFKNKFAKQIIYIRSIIIQSSVFQAHTRLGMTNSLIIHFSCLLNDSTPYLYLQSMNHLQFVVLFKWITSLSKSNILNQHFNSRLG